MAVAGATALLAACGTGTKATAHPASLAVVVDGLANPRQMSFGPDGTLYVAEAGSGGHARCAKDPSTGAQICVGPSGAIDRVVHGALQRVVSGLPSVAGSSGRDASGPADVIVSHGRLILVTQDTQITSTGANQFARPGRLLGQLLAARLTGGLRVLADLARFEASHNADRGIGATTVANAVDSDPYGLVSYHGGYAVADAAGNDLLWVSPTGRIRVLAVFGVQSELAPAGVVAKTVRRVAAQSVPTSVAVGPDGALYVSELSGFPFDPGYARIWRVVPGQRATVYARGFTNISAITFDHRGRLLVLEINRSGLRNAVGPGELIRVDTKGRRSVLASAGLSSPTGLAVAADGTIFVANNGASTATGRGVHGEIVRVLTR